VLWTGVAAGLASLGQMIVGEILTYRAAHGSSKDNVQTLFKVLNNGDTLKIALLAAMIAAASLLARRSGAFPLNSDALYASLDVTLLGLLIWVVAVTIVVARRAKSFEAVAQPAVQ